MSISPEATASDQNATLECKICQAFLEAAEEVRPLNEKKLAGPSKTKRRDERHGLLNKEAYWDSVIRRK